MARELDSLSVSARLASFAVNTPAATLPHQILHEAKRSLVNLFATSLAGCQDPAVAAAARVFERFRSSSQCTVIGHSARTDALHAASLNAMSSNVFDFDDTHIPTIIHPTAPVAPALMALAQTRRVSGQDLLMALAVGVEVECRLGNALSPWHYSRGWHITSTCGVFGAAAACARLMGLDPTRTLWALGHASAQSSGLVQTLGSMSKSIGVGNASSNGLLSALLAAEGFEGPAAPIEGPRGFLDVMGQQADLQALTQDLGVTWELSRNTYKPYPCGVVLNPVIEACLSLYHQQGVRLDAVDQIEVRGLPLLRQRTDRPAPTSGREAQVSTHHAVTATLAHGRAGLDQFSDASLRLPEAGRLAHRIIFHEDPSFNIDAASVTLRLLDGSTRQSHVSCARGSLAMPLSDVELEEKLRQLSSWGGSGCDAEGLLQAIWVLEKNPDAGALLPLASGHH